MYTFELEFIDDSQTRSFRLAREPSSESKCYPAGAAHRHATSRQTVPQRDELDEQIDRLVAELEQIRKEGHENSPLAPDLVSLLYYCPKSEPGAHFPCGASGIAAQST